MRSNQTLLKNVDAKTTHEILKIMRNHFPKQTTKCLNIIQTFSYFAIAWADDSYFTEFDDSKEPNVVKANKSTKSMKGLVEQILDRSKLEPKLIGNKGQVLTMRKFTDFIKATVDELNSFDSQHMQNNKSGKIFSAFY